MLNKTAGHCRQKLNKTPPPIKSPVTTATTAIKHLTPWPKFDKFFSLFFGAGLRSVRLCRTPTVNSIGGGRKYKKNVLKTTTRTQYGADAHKIGIKCGAWQPKPICWGGCHSGNGLSASSRASIHLIRPAKGSDFRLLAVNETWTDSHTTTHRHTSIAWGKVLKIDLRADKFLCRGQLDSFDLPLKLKIAKISFDAILTQKSSNPLSQSASHLPPLDAKHVQHFSTLFRQRWADPRHDCEMCQFDVNEDGGEGAQWATISGS